MHLGKGRRAFTEFSSAWRWLSSLVVSARPQTFSMASPQGNTTGRPGVFFLCSLPSPSLYFPFPVPDAPLKGRSRPNPPQSLGWQGDTDFLYGSVRINLAPYSKGWRRREASAVASGSRSRHLQAMSVFQEAAARFGIRVLAYSLRSLQQAGGQLV
jgi:hypothetical protein